MFRGSTALCIHKLKGPENWKRFPELSSPRIALPMAPPPPRNKAVFTHPSWRFFSSEPRRRLQVFMNKADQWPLLDPGQLHSFPGILGYFIPQKYLHEVGETGASSFP